MQVGSVIIFVKLCFIYYCDNIGSNNSNSYIILTRIEMLDLSKKLILEM